MQKEKDDQSRAMSDRDMIPKDTLLRLEALKLALGQGGGADQVVRDRAEAYLAFLKGEPAP